MALRMWTRAIAVLMVVLAPVCVMAQPKPDRPDPPPPPPPLEINARDFAEVYNAANRPTVLTLVGFSTGEREAAAVESTLFNVDQAGLTFELRSAFNEFINPPTVNLEMVSATQLNAAIGQLGEQLKARKEKEAAVLLATQARAEIVILIRLFGDKQAGTPQKGQMEVTDARGRELFSYPFGWVMGTDTASVRIVARNLALSFTNDYIVRARTPKRWTVRLFDLRDPAIALDIASRLKATPGISSVRQRAGSANAADSYRELEVTTSLESLELEAIVSQGVKDRDLRAETMSTDGGILNIRVRQKEVAPTSEPALPKKSVEASGALLKCVEVMADRESKDGSINRIALEQMYTRRQQPTFAVLVNRQPTDSERRRAADAGAASGGGGVHADNVIVISQGSSSVGASGTGTGASNPTDTPPTADAEFQSISEINNINYSLETHVYNLLGTELLNFNRRVDGPTARARVLEVAKNQKATYSEDELSELLRQSNIADYYIIATGTILKSPQFNDAYDLKYNFRLLDRQGKVAATAPDLIGWAPRGTMTDIATRNTGTDTTRSERMPGLNVEDLARKAVAKIACELLNEWQRDIQVLVRLKGISDGRDFLAIDDSYRKNAKDVRIVGDPRNVNIGGGQGTLEFTMSYPSRMTFTDVMREINDLNAKLPFDLVFESGDVSSGIVLEIKNRRTAP